MLSKEEAIKGLRESKVFDRLMTKERVSNVDVLDKPSDRGLWTALEEYKIVTSVLIEFPNREPGVALYLRYFYLTDKQIKGLILK